MSITNRILYKSFVKPFYRLHAGMFIFLFIVLFGAVGVVDGAGILHFHFSLIQGMLKNWGFFVPVLIVWILYAKKTEQFVVNRLRQPDYSFIQILSTLDNRILLCKMIWVEFLLLMPIIIYTLFILIVGVFIRSFISCLVILFVIYCFCMTIAQWYRFTILNPGRNNKVKQPVKKSKPVYWTFFARYIIKDKKLIFSGIKIYTCVLLYLMVVNQTHVEYDLSMILLFFSLGILGHGLLIHQLRNLEETAFRFYRTLPVSLAARFYQYAILYFVILIPEFIVLFFLTPRYLHVRDAVLFSVFCYTLLLFMNSLLFIRFFKMKDYLKIILSVFFLIYLSILSQLLPLLCLFFAITSLAIFYGRYERFERI